jgi:hypothetical protein
MRIVVCIIGYKLVRQNRKKNPAGQGGVNKLTSLPVDEEE